MSEDGRPSEKERDAAAALVEAAAASGRIIGPDRDLRVGQVRTARTRGELAMIVRDLVPPEPVVPPEPPRPVGGSAGGWHPPPPTQTAPPTMAPTEATPAASTVTPGSPREEYGAPQPVPLAPTPAHPPRSRALLGPPVAVVLVVGLCLVGVVLAVAGSVTLGGSGGSSSSASESALARPEAGVLTRDGYAQLFAALRRRAGGTVASSAVLYPTYASVDVPVEGRAGRQATWYWDGALRRTGVEAAAGDRRFDLADVDARVMVRLVRRVVRLVEEPTVRYVLVSAAPGGGLRLSAYATNEASETAYLVADRRGRLLQRVVPE